MKDWILIANPASASALMAEQWKVYMRMLTAGGVQVEGRVTERPGHAIALAEEAAAAGCRRFMVAGGDGTIHEVLTGLLRWCDREQADMGDFTLAVLPKGTGNDWIRTAGVPNDAKGAVQCVLAGHTARQDVVRLTFENGTFCLANVGGIGLDADICHYTNKMKKKGRKGGILYKLVAPYSIFAKKRRPVEIVCDGECIFRGKLFSAVIGNGLYRGGGLRQTEKGARWDDGWLEVSVMPDVNDSKAVYQMYHVLKGDFATLPGIISRRFRRMTVTPLSGEPDRVESDGEIPGTIPVTVEVTGQQIQIIVP